LNSPACSTTSANTLPDLEQILPPINLLRTFWANKPLPQVSPNTPDHAGQQALSATSTAVEEGFRTLSQTGGASVKVEPRTIATVPSPRTPSESRSEASQAIQSRPHINNSPSAPGQNSLLISSRPIVRLVSRNRAQRSSNRNSQPVSRATAIASHLKQEQPSESVGSQTTGTTFDPQPSSQPFLPQPPRHTKPAAQTQPQRVDTAVPNSSSKQEELDHRNSSNSSNKLVPQNETYNPNRSLLVPRNASPSAGQLGGVGLVPGRCQAITLKGTQCSFRHKPGRKYCGKHRYEDDV
jgi:hypothetical protein